MTILMESREHTSWTLGCSNRSDSFSWLSGLMRLGPSIEWKSTTTLCLQLSSSSLYLTSWSWRVILSIFLARPTSIRNPPKWVQIFFSLTEGRYPLTSNVCRPLRYFLWLSLRRSILEPLPKTQTLWPAMSMSLSSSISFLAWEERLGWRLGVRVLQYQLNLSVVQYQSSSSSFSGLCLVTLFLRVMQSRWQGLPKSPRRSSSSSEKAPRSRIIAFCFFLQAIPAQLLILCSTIQNVLNISQGLAASNDRLCLRPSRPCSGLFEAHLVSPNLQEIEYSAGVALEEPPVQPYVLGVVHFEFDGEGGVVGQEEVPFPGQAQLHLEGHPVDVGLPQEEGLEFLDLALPDGLDPRLEAQFVGHHRLGAVEAGVFLLGGLDFLFALSPFVAGLHGLLEVLEVASYLLVEDAVVPLDFGVSLLLEHVLLLSRKQPTFLLIFRRLSVMLAEVTVLLRGSCLGESRGLLSKSFSSLSLLIWSRLITYIITTVGARPSLVPGKTLRQFSMHQK